MICSTTAVRRIGNCQRESRMREVQDSKLQGLLPCHTDAVPVLLRTVRTSHTSRPAPSTLYLTGIAQVHQTIKPPGGHGVKQPGDIQLDYAFGRRRCRHWERSEEEELTSTFSLPQVLTTRKTDETLKYVVLRLNQNDEVSKAAGG